MDGVRTFSLVSGRNASSINLRLNSNNIRWSSTTESQTWTAEMRGCAWNHEGGCCWPAGGPDLTLYYRTQVVPFWLSCCGIPAGCSPRAVQLHLSGTAAVKNPIAARKVRDLMICLKDHASCMQFRALHHVLHNVTLSVRLYLLQWDLTL